MEEYFKLRIEQLDHKIAAWNNKNFFQRLFSKEKWSDEETGTQLEKIFYLDSISYIKSSKDFSVYMMYFMKYQKALPDELSNNIVKRLLTSEYLSPQVEILLKQFLEADLARQFHHNQAMGIINLINK